MECNKDEAIRAKEIAEKKFAGKDLEGAKKFTCKAQQLYPGLEGLQQMMDVLDVHLAAENKFNGEIDWYGILHVNATDDDATVRKQYRKLALLLHPDKNKSIGADAAFKLISEAWSVLSDKDKKQNYDRRRNSRGLQSRISTQKPKSRPDCSNGFYNFTAAFNSNSSKRPQPAAPLPDTFWTSCPHCKMQYEYQRIYVNHNLLCQNCKSAFLAVETSESGSNGFTSGFQWSFSTSASQDKHFKFSYQQQQQQQKFPGHQHQQFATQHKAQYGTHQHQYSNYQRQYSNHHYFHGKDTSSALPRIDPFSNTSYSWGPFSRPPGNATESKEAAATYVQQTYEKVKRDREAAQVAAKMRDSLKMRDQARMPSVDASTVQFPEYFFSSGSHGISEQIPTSKAPELKIKRKRKHKINGESEEDVGGEDEEKQSFPMNDPEAMGANMHKPFRPKKSVDNKFSGSEGKNNKQTVSFQEQQNRDFVQTLNDKVSETNKNRPLGRPLTNRCVPHVEIRNSLIELARKEIRKQLNDTKRVDVDPAEVKWENKPTDLNDGADSQLPGNEISKAQTDDKKQIQFKKTSSSKLEVPNGVGTREDITGSNDAEPVSITVPDPDFHDFDNDRTEKCFKENQIWAAYDDDDGMPRFYALIHKVISLKPFMVSMSWLNSKNNDDLAPIEWMSAGFTKTCGDFRSGKAENCDNLHVFSHIIRWEKAPRGVMKIFPKKGDVWALYREWSAEWDESTPPEVVHKYDMVEVLSDFTEELGVSVIPLVKVVGFKTIFQRKQFDAEAIQWFPKKELFRFSHQVPSYVFSGEEDKRIPKDCRELDPAATPLELLHVVNEESKAAGKC